MCRVTILYAESHEAVRSALKETFELEGWRVDACADGRDALAGLEGGERYDLLLLDDDLPGVRGLELARRARLLSQHERTPVVVTSSDDVGAEARRAGANAFLRKPDCIRHITLTVAQLLKGK